MVTTPKEGLVCFGAVLHVRRRWVTKVVPRWSRREAHWTYWASVHVLGKARLCMISKAVFEDLVAKGAKQLADACLHPHVGTPPPGPTVRE